MTKVEKTSEFTEFVYLKNNPLGLVNDLNSDHKYRGNVILNNKQKLSQVLSYDAMHLIFYLDFLMKPKKNDMIAAITYNISKNAFPFLNRRTYPLVIQELIDRNIIVKVNNNLANRLFYINPCVVCKLTKDQRNEFALVHFEYFRSLE